MGISACGNTNQSAPPVSGTDTLESRTKQTEVSLPADNNSSIGGDERNENNISDTAGVKEALGTGTVSVSFQAEDTQDTTQSSGNDILSTLKRKLVH